jgi:hypothetical protein
MKKRIPVLLFAIGLLGVMLYTRLSAALPPAMRTDFVTGVMMGVFIGIELVGAMMMTRRSRCRTA